MERNGTERVVKIVVVEFILLWAGQTLLNNFPFGLLNQRIQQTYYDQMQVNGMPLIDLCLVGSLGELKGLD